MKMTRINRALLALAGIAMLLTIGSGCAAQKPVTAQTPQYKAALGSDDLAIAMNTLCVKTEPGFADSIGPDLDRQIQQACLEGATDNKKVRAAIQAGDFTTAKAALQSMVALFSGLTPEMAHIKNPDSKLAMTAATGILVAIATS